MRDEAIGNVLVTVGGGLHGIVTDRDIVVRVIAESRDPTTTVIGDCCSGDLVTAGPEDDADGIIWLMREWAVRRVLVVNAGKPVGIVSLGDMAMERDGASVLADISAALPNR